MERKIKNLLENKGHAKFTIAKDATIYEAVTQLTEHKVGALFVVDGGETVVGIITERDVLRVVFENCDDLKERKVSEFMTEELYVASPDDDLNYAMSLMTDQKFRHLPIVENNQLVGMISIGDVVKSLRSDDQYEIHQLKKFIAGNYPQ